MIKEHWMNKQLRLIEEESKNWPQWRKDEAHRRFGLDSTDNSNCSFEIWQKKFFMEMLENAQSSN